MTIPPLVRAASMAVGDYDPGRVMDAVNALQPLGKDEALARVEAYLRERGEGDSATGLFWVLRVLFDAPAESGFPPVGLGTPNVAPPGDPAALPRFPVVMVGDVPFLLVRGYLLRGFPEPVQSHVDWYRAHGTLRARPLTIPPSTAGLREAFLRTCEAAYGDCPALALAAVDEQLARLAGGRSGPGDQPSSG